MPGTSPSKQAGQDDENFIDGDYETIDFRAMCRDKKLTQTGIKADLISRLRGEDSLEGPPFKRFKRPSLEKADQPPEPPAPPDQAGQPANLADDVQNKCADWLSAQDVQNRCAPKHGKIMDRVMQRAQTRKCDITGQTLYKIAVYPPMRHPGVNGLNQCVIWSPEHSNSDSS